MHESVPENEPVVGWLKKQTDLLHLDELPRHFFQVLLLQHLILRQLLRHRTNNSSREKKKREKKGKEEKKEEKKRGKVYKKKY